MRGNQHKLSLFKMEKSWMDEHSQKQVLPSRGNDIDQAIRGHRRCLSVVLICGQVLDPFTTKRHFPTVSTKRFGNTVTPSNADALTT